MDQGKFRTLITHLQLVWNRVPHLSDIRLGICVDQLVKVWKLRLMEAWGPLCHRAGTQTRPGPFCVFLALRALSEHQHLLLAAPLAEAIHRKSSYQKTPTLTRPWP
ncbi:hypothetical protein CapIbe_011469 [Capra ibex]